MALYAHSPPTPSTYHPVVAQLAEPLKVIFIAYSLLHQRGQHVPRVDVQHHQGSEGHPVLLGQRAPYESHDVVNLSVVLLQVGVQGLRERGGVEKKPGNGRSLSRQREAAIKTPSKN